MRRNVGLILLRDGRSTEHRVIPRQRSKRSLSGAKRTSAGADAVDGACSAASKCCRLAESTRAIQGETGHDGAFELERIGEDRRGNADKVDPGIGTTRMGQHIFESVLSIESRSAQQVGH
jgi:hypothetical protein